MPKFSPYNDNYNDYHVVVESESGSPEDTKILKHNDGQGGLNFLRFYTCLQSTGRRNRNGRMWTKKFLAPMLEAPHILELMNERGGLPGENGHPIPMLDKTEISIARLMTIDPNNTSHIIKEMRWEGDRIFGVVETLDEGPGSAGMKFMNNILQKMDPAFSVRSIVPQRKNADGTIDVVGVGRVVCYDRVHLPSHSDAYIEKTVPIKSIVTRSTFDSVMEGFTDFVLGHSEKVNRILDNMEPAVESAAIDRTTGSLLVPTDVGIVIIEPEKKYRKEIRDFMKNF